MPNLVIICGPQAVGKMTVGQELSKITDYRLFHNHMTVEITRLIFDYDKVVFRRMNDILRFDILKEYSKSNEKGIIFTCCFDFGKDLEEDKKIFDDMAKMFKNTYFIELEASLEERLKRNATENRLQNKPSKRNLEWSNNDLLNSMVMHKFNSEPGEGEKLFKNYIKINNEKLEPDKVAKIIKEKYSL